MTITHTHTTSVEQLDSNGFAIDELDVTIAFHNHKGSRATRIDPACDDELEVLTVTHGGKDAPGWAWDAATTTAIQSEMREVVAADSEDAAEFLADCRRDEAMMRDWDDR